MVQALLVALTWIIGSVAMVAADRLVVRRAPKLSGFLVIMALAMIVVGRLVGPDLLVPVGFLTEAVLVLSLKIPLP